MAAIALVTASTSHAAATNTSAALQGGGHTVTMVADTAVSTHDFTPYAVVVLCRSDPNTAGVTTTIRALLDAGKPVIAGMTSAGMTAGTGKAHSASALRLTGTAYLASDAEQASELDLTNVTHPITTGLTLGRLAVLAVANFFAVVDTGQSHSGTALANGDPDVTGTVGKVALVAIEAGSLDMDGVATGARAVASGHIYAGQSDYTQAGKDLLNNAVAWAVATPPPPTPPNLRKSTDFSGYTVGAGAPAGWSTPFGTGWVSVVADAAALGGKALRIAPNTGYTGRGYLLWDEPGSPVDVEIVLALRKAWSRYVEGDIQRETPEIGPLFRTSINTAPNPDVPTGYVYSYSPTDELLMEFDPAWSNPESPRLLARPYWEAVNNSTQADLQKLIFVRLRCFQNRVMGMVWEHGQEEPPGWMEIRDADWYSSGAPAAFMEISPDRLGKVGVANLGFEEARIEYIATGKDGIDAMLPGENDARPYRPELNASAAANVLTLRTNYQSPGSVAHGATRWQIAVAPLRREDLAAAFNNPVMDTGWDATNLLSYSFTGESGKLYVFRAKVRDTGGLESGWGKATWVFTGNQLARSNYGLLVDLRTGVPTDANGKFLPPHQVVQGSWTKELDNRLLATMGNENLDQFFSLSGWHEADAIDGLVIQGAIESDAGMSAGLVSASQVDLLEGITLEAHRVQNRAVMRVYKNRDVTASPEMGHETQPIAVTEWFKIAIAGYKESGFFVGYRLAAASAGGTVQMGKMDQQGFPSPLLPQHVVGLWAKFVGTGAATGKRAWFSSLVVTRGNTIVVRGLPDGFGVNTADWVKQSVGGMAVYEAGRTFWPQASDLWITDRNGTEVARIAGPLWGGDEYTWGDATAPAAPTVSILGTTYFPLPTLSAYAGSYPLKEVRWRIEQDSTQGWKPLLDTGWSTTLLERWPLPIDGLPKGFRLRVNAQYRDNRGTISPQSAWVTFTIPWSIPPAQTIPAEYGGGTTPIPPATGGAAEDTGAVTTGSAGGGTPVDLSEPQPWRERGPLEFKSEFEALTPELTPKHVTVGASTTKRPDAISLDYFVSFSPGPETLFSRGSGVLERTWMCRYDPATGQVWMARSSISVAQQNLGAAGVWEAETLLTTLSTDVAELDLAFDQNGAPVICAERPGLGGPEVWLYWFSPVASAYVFEKMGNGRNPRGVLDDPESSNESDVLIFYVNPGVDRLCYRQQRDLYATEYLTPVGQVANYYLEDVALGGGRRLQVLGAVREPVTGTWSIALLESAPYPTRVSDAATTAHQLTSLETLEYVYLFEYELNHFVQHRIQTFDTTDLLIIIGPPGFGREGFVTPEDAATTSGRLTSVTQSEFVIVHNVSPEDAATTAGRLTTVDVTTYVITPPALTGDSATSSHRISSIALENV